MIKIARKIAYASLMLAAIPPLQGCNANSPAAPPTTASVSPTTSNSPYSPDQVDLTSPTLQGPLSNHTASPLLANLPAGSTIAFSRPLDLPFSRNGASESIENDIKIGASYIPGHSILFADGTAYTAADLQNLDREKRQGLLDNNCILNFYDIWVEGGLSNPVFADRILQGSYLSELPEVESAVSENTDDGPKRIDTYETVSIGLSYNAVINTIVCQKSLKGIDAKDLALAGSSVEDLKRHVGSGVQVVVAASAKKP